MTDSHASRLPIGPNIESLMQRALRLERYGERDAAIAIYEAVGNGKSEHAPYAKSCAERLREYDSLAAPPQSGGAAGIPVFVVILVLAGAIGFGRFEQAKQAKQADAHLEEMKARMLADPEFKAKWDRLKGRDQEQMMLLLKELSRPPQLNSINDSRPLDADQK